MRAFETVLADSRVALKGFLNAGSIERADKVSERHILQLKSLLLLITEFQLDHPISLLSNGISPFLFISRIGTIQMHYRTVHIKSRVPIYSVKN